MDRPHTLAFTNLGRRRRKSHIGWRWWECHIDLRRRGGKSHVGWRWWECHIDLRRRGRKSHALREQAVFCRRIARERSLPLRKPIWSWRCRSRRPGSRRCVRRRRGCSWHGNTLLLVAAVAVPAVVVVVPVIAVVTPQTIVIDFRSLYPSLGPGSIDVCLESVGRERGGSGCWRIISTTKSQRVSLQPNRLQRRESVSGVGTGPGSSFSIHWRAT